MFLLKRKAAQDGLRVRDVKLPFRTSDPQEIVGAITRAVANDTKVFFFSHCNCTTGLVMPASELCRAMRERGVMTICDGAHAPGMIPVDLEQVGADFYGANCHKWIMAPAGSGFLHARAERKAMLRPLITSWGYEYDRAKADDDSKWGGSFWQRDLEFHGTVDRCPQMALPQTLDFRVTCGGTDATLARSRRIVGYCRAKLAEIGLEPAITDNPRLSGSLAAFDFPTDDLIAIRDRMWNEFHIECPVTEAAGQRFLRVSAAWFNTKEEVDRLVEAVRTIQGR
jgi:isopenicillin-N epimerase